MGAPTSDRAIVDLRRRAQTGPRPRLLAVRSRAGGAVPCVVCGRRCAGSPRDPLSPRPASWATTLLAQGLSNREIAALCSSANTPSVIISGMCSRNWGSPRGPRPWCARATPVVATAGVITPSRWASVPSDRETLGRSGTVTPHPRPPGGSHCDHVHARHGSHRQHVSGVRAADRGAGDPDSQRATGRGRRSAGTSPASTGWTCHCPATNSGTSIDAVHPPTTQSTRRPRWTSPWRRNPRS